MWRRVVGRGAVLVVLSTQALACNDDEDAVAAVVPEPVEGVLDSCAVLNGEDHDDDDDLAYTLGGATRRLSRWDDASSAVPGRDWLRIAEWYDGGGALFVGQDGADLRAPSETPIPLSLGFIGVYGGMLCFGAGTMARPEPNGKLAVRSSAVVYSSHGGEMVEGEIKFCRDDGPCPDVHWSLAGVELQPEKGQHQPVLIQQPTLEQDALSLLIVGNSWLAKAYMYFVEGEVADLPMGPAWIVVITLDDHPLGPGLYDGTGEFDSTVGFEVTFDTFRKVADCGPNAGNEALLSCYD